MRTASPRSSANDPNPEPSTSPICGRKAVCDSTNAAADSARLKRSGVISFRSQNNDKLQTMREYDQTTNENNDAPFHWHGHRPVPHRPATICVEHYANGHSASEQILEQRTTHTVSTPPEFHFSEVLLKLSKSSL